jgi:hypothetical protein
MRELKKTSRARNPGTFLPALAASFTGDTPSGTSMRGFHGIRPMAASNPSAANMNLPWNQELALR